MLRIAFVSLVICASAWTYIGASGTRTNDANDVGGVILVDRLGKQALLSEGQTVTVQELGLTTLSRVHVARGHRHAVRECYDHGGVPAICRRQRGPAHPIHADAHRGHHDRDCRTGVVRLR